MKRLRQARAKMSIQTRRPSVIMSRLLTHSSEEYNRIAGRRRNIEPNVFKTSHQCSTEVLCCFLLVHRSERCDRGLMNIDFSYVARETWAAGCRGIHHAFLMKTEQTSDAP